MKIKRKPNPLHHRSLWPRAAQLLLLIVLAAAPCFATARPVGVVGEQGSTPGHPKLARDLRAGNRTALIDVIVQFRGTPRAAYFSRMASRGAAVRSKLPGIRAVAFRLPASAIAALENDPNVLYVTPDRPVHLTARNENYVAPVLADVAVQQYGLDGAGIAVAVIDSGVSGHGDLKKNSADARIAYSESFVAGDTSTDDGYGHGTHVAGIVAGNGNGSSAGTSGYSSKFAGLAPGAKIVNLRVLDSTGSGTDSQVIAAIQRAIQLKAQYNIRVINLSLGRPVFESYTLDPLCQAVEQAWQAGIVVVVAAGNSGRDNSHGTLGYATIGAPGNDPAVITVGAARTMGTASRNDDTIASYSSKGPSLIDHIAKPDIVAPGNRVASLLVKGSTLDVKYPTHEVAPGTLACTQDCSPKYFRLSGTSMATPVVAGAVALLLQQDPTLTPDTVKARLMKTAWKGFATYATSYDNYNNPFSNQYDVFTYGAGYLDVSAALANSDVADGVALSPTAVFDSASGTVSLVNTDSVIWGSSVIWGTSVVWGNSVIWGNTIDANSVIWGNSVVWGNSFDQGYSVIWGSSVVWGNSVGAFSDGMDGEE